MNLTISPINNRTKKNNTNINFKAAIVKPEVRSFITNWLPEFAEDNGFLFISKESQGRLESILNNYRHGFWAQRRSKKQAQALINEYPNRVLNPKEIDEAKFAGDKIKYPLLQVINNNAKLIGMDQVKAVFAEHAKRLLQLEEGINKQFAQSMDTSNGVVEQHAAERLKDDLTNERHALVNKIYEELGLLS